MVDVANFAMFLWNKLDGERANPAMFIELIQAAARNLSLSSLAGQ